MHHIYPVKEGTLMKFKHAHAAFTDRIFSIKSLTRNLTLNSEIIHSVVLAATL